MFYFHKGIDIPWMNRKSSVHLLIAKIQNMNLRSCSNSEKICPNFIWSMNSVVKLIVFKILHMFTENVDLKNADFL